MKRRVIYIVALISCLVGLFSVPGVAAADMNALRPGFDQNILPRGDDNYSGLVDIGFSLNFYGKPYTQLYINTNGNVTFDAPLANWVPFDIVQSAYVIIAPFFTDINTTTSGSPITYGQGIINGHAAFGINWIDVANTGDSTTNSFQLVLIQRNDTGIGNFDIEFNYGEINWINSSYIRNYNARAGYTNGSYNPNQCYELTQSGTPDMMNLASLTNSSQPGRFNFEVHSSSPTGADLSIYNHQVAPERVRPGQNLTYTIGVMNAGPSTVTGVVLTDEMSQDVTFVSIERVAGIDWTSNTSIEEKFLTSNLPDLNPSEHIDLELIVNVNENATETITNIANVYGLVADPNPENNIYIYTSSILLNSGPIVTDDEYEGNYETPLIVNAPGVLGNDSDIDEDILTASVVDSPTNGELIFNENGSFTYTPYPEYFGTDSFTYEASDGRLVSDTAIVVININPPNSKPIAKANGPYYGSEYTEITLSAQGSEDEDFDALLFRWDWNGDGIFDTEYTSEEEYSFTPIKPLDAMAILEVYDGKEASRDYAEIKISNVVPIVTLGEDIVINESDTFTGTGSFSEPGIGDFTATVNYGDNSPTDNLILNADRTFQLSHQYIISGVFNITVKITDDAGGIGQDTLKVTVNNILPVVTLSDDAVIKEGATFTGSGSYTDPSNGVFTATVNYGDNSPVVNLPLNPDRTFQLSHKYNDVGVFQVIVQVTDDAGGIGEATIQVTVIKKATATVTLDNLTQTYTGSALTPTVTTNPAGLSIIWTGVPQTNAGSYPVTATVNDPDYTGSASGSFIINKATATVTLGNLTQNYTGSPLMPSAVTNPAGLAITWTGAPQTNAGTYTVTATVNDANYQGTASGSFVINKATATVTLGNLTQTYTGNPLMPSAVPNPAGLAITWTGAPQTNAGTYTVTATVNDANYQGTASGSFVINKATSTATVTLDNLTQTYTGSALTPTATTNPAGLSLIWTGAPQTNAGSYTVTATVNNPDYIGSASGSFVINKAMATITLGNLTQNYTGSPLMPSAITNPAGLAITWTGAPQTNAGTYTVTATVNDANYQGTASGSFVISNNINAKELKNSTISLLEQLKTQVNNKDIQRTANKAIEDIEDSLEPSLWIDNNHLVMNISNNHANDLFDRFTKEGYTLRDNEINDNEDGGVRCEQGQSNGLSVFNFERKAAVQLSVNIAQYQRNVLELQRKISYKESKNQDASSERAELGIFNNAITVFTRVNESLAGADRILAQVLINDVSQTTVKDPRYQRIVEFQLGLARASFNAGVRADEDGNKVMAITHYRNAWVTAELAMKFCQK